MGKTLSPRNPVAEETSFPVPRNNLLSELGEKHQPTKRLHNYLPYYWLHFRDIRLEVKAVCEIGLQTDRSLRMWEEFFPNAVICGLDIDPACKRFEGERRKVFIGNQSDREFLYSVLDRVGTSFDIVIDDGSHLVEHQQATFEILFPEMAGHGIYAIEDTGGCVGDAELQTVNWLKSAVDHIMHWPAGFPPSKWRFLRSFPEAAWADRNIIGVAFYRWLVLVMRGRNPEDNPFLLSEADPAADPVKPTPPSAF